MNRHNGDNIGGFHTLYLAKVKDLTSENFDAQKFTEIYFTAQTGQWKRNMKESKNDVYFENQLVFEVPKFRKEVEDYICETNEVALIAYIVLINGEFVCIGSLQSPLFLTTDFESGKNYADFNSYAFKGTATEAVNMKKNSAIIITPPKIKTKSYALKLNNNKYATMPTDGLPSGNVNVSMAIKVRVKEIVSFEAYAGYGGSSANEIILIGNFGGCFILVTGSGNGICTADVFPTGVYEVLITKEPGLLSNTKIYVNGQLQNLLLIGTDAVLDIKLTQGAIGQWLQTNSFNPNINFFYYKIWNRALTLSEVSNIQTANSALIRNYEFDDSQGFILTEKISAKNAILMNYLPSETTKGIDNYWLDINENPVLV